MTDYWREKAGSMIQRAVMAPSSHNTQPWIFRVSDWAIDLWADRTRCLPVNDPEDRELAISCGSALTASLRSRLQDLVGREFPQILLRIGYPAEAAPESPRRRIEDVTEWAD